MHVRGSDSGRMGPCLEQKIIEYFTSLFTSLQLLNQQALGVMWQLAFIALVTVFVCVNAVSLNVLRSDIWLSKVFVHVNLETWKSTGIDLCEFHDVIVDEARVFFKPRPEFVENATLDLFRCCMGARLKNRNAIVSECVNSVNHMLCYCFTDNYWPAVEVGIHKNTIFIGRKTQTIL